MAQNTLYYGDNLDILRRYVKDESVDLIYLDPPFNSNATYNVLFTDKARPESQAQIGPTIARFRMMSTTHPAPARTFAGILPVLARFIAPVGKEGGHEVLPYNTPGDSSPASLPPGLPVGADLVSARPVVRCEGMFQRRFSGWFSSPAPSPKRLWRVGDSMGED